MIPTEAHAIAQAQILALFIDTTWERAVGVCTGTLEAPCGREFVSKERFIAALTSAYEQGRTEQREVVLDGVAECAEALKHRSSAGYDRLWSICAIDTPWWHANPGGTFVHWVADRLAQLRGGREMAQLIAQSNKMTTRRPDAFDTLAHMPESWHENQSMDSTEQWVAKLLRAQHAKVRRMVRDIGRMATTSQFSTSNECIAYRTACTDILAALDRKRRILRKP